MKYNIQSIEKNDRFTFFWKPGSNNTPECFSQWQLSDFEDKEGNKYISAEQYMMAQKALLFNDKEVFNQIMRENNQKNIKHLGRKVRNFDNKLWEENKSRIVTEGNVLKFSQNKDMLDTLLSTEDDILIEASPYDRIWGIGMKVGDRGIYDPSKWKGENLLGFILMEVRDKLR